MTWNRVPCLGGCKREVLKERGECGHCRRKRVKAGVRRIARLGRAETGWKRDLAQKANAQRAKADRALLHVVKKLYGG